MAEEPKEVWYLMGAWLLGATMNAIMTWWAVSLTLLENPVGNAILSREVILKVVPIFVAVLVWLTRILFIGALSVTGDHLFSQQFPVVQQRAPQPAMIRANKGSSRRPQRTAVVEGEVQTELIVEPKPVKPTTRKSKPKTQIRGNIRPNRPGMRPTPRPAHAKTYKN